MAQSIVNLGGFGATLVVLASMGALMTALGGFTPIWAFAVLGVVSTRRKARSLDAEHGVVPRPMRQVVSARLGSR